MSLPLWGVERLFYRFRFLQFTALPKGAATDKQIDRLVYQLYRLTDDEIHTAEDATP